MNILKPQNLKIKELENRNFSDVSKDEKIDYCNFENDKY